MAEQPGTCRVRRLDGDRVWIEQADSLIWSSVELLEAVENQPCPEDVHLTVRPQHCMCGAASYGDGSFTIRGENRTVSYGVGEYLLAPHAYVARKSPEPVADG